MITINGELYHYGVKGMKWGVRRYQPYPSGKQGNFVGKVKNLLKGDPAKAEARKVKKTQKRIAKMEKYKGKLINRQKFGISWNEDTRAREKADLDDLKRNKYYSEVYKNYRKERIDRDYDRYNDSSILTEEQRNSPLRKKSEENIKFWANLDPSTAETDYRNVYAMKETKIKDASRSIRKGKEAIKRLEEYTVSETTTKKELRRINRGG